MEIDTDEETDRRHRIRPCKIKTEPSIGIIPALKNTGVFIYDDFSEDKISEAE